MDEPGVARTLVPGEVLFRAGDATDNVLLVLDGNLDVVHQVPAGEVVIGTLGPGDIAGEIAALVGGPRTATVRAGAGPVSLREMTAEQYRLWLARRPGEAARIAALARDRLDRTRVTRVLTELMGADYPEVIADTIDLLDWTRLDAGAVLFEQGDEADAAYIVVTGRLQLTATIDGRVTLDAEVGRGDIVGELGVIEKAPRSATARATQDTTLARLSLEAFETLTARRPRLMLGLFRKILTRVMRPTRPGPRDAILAIAVLDPRGDPCLVRNMAAEISRHGATLVLDGPQVERFFANRGIADTAIAGAEQAQLDEFLSEVDASHRWVLLETDRTLSPWSRRALGAADRVVLITSAFPDRDELANIEAFIEVVESGRSGRCWHVQANAASIDRPSLNTTVQGIIRPDRTLQLHRGSPASTARVARLLSGNATGAALSGGGGRGLAHIGALSALQDSGITIDVVTGTSMGSIVAASMAYNADAAKVLAQLHEGFAAAKIVEYTIPVVSLASGIGLTKAINRMWGPMLIEELTLPFACLSTNLTTASQVVHRTGPLATSLRASVSLPGVFPPVVLDGEFLVDGGVLENLPVGPLVEDPMVSRVIAVDVAPMAGPSSKVRKNAIDGVAGLTALRSQLSRRAQPYPPLATIVLASMLLGSAQSRNQAIADDSIDLYLSLNLKGVKLLDFADLATVSTLGYEATKAQLERANE